MHSTVIVLCFTRSSTLYSPGKQLCPGPRSCCEPYAMPDIRLVGWEAKEVQESIRLLRPKPTAMASERSQELECGAETQPRGR
ncbi:hypothetical protein U0070_024185, partial [Myodes glareolus]